MNPNCGIYKIENLINNKCYIGQSINLKNRQYVHFYYLKNNIEGNNHLQYAYNKYGKNNFKFSVLLYCEAFELTKYEKFFDNYYKKSNLSYNIRECIDSNKGISVSEKTKEKISMSKKGKSNGRIGYKHSERAKNKIREALKGNANGRPTQFSKGHKVSDETREKIRNTLIQKNKLKHNRI